MTLRDFGLLADENIGLPVIEFLQDEGFIVLDVSQSELVGSSDRALIEHAYANNLVVITHDPDFGTLACAGLQPHTEGEKIKTSEKRSEIWVLNRNT